jgi:transcriptional antiterminator NusG
MSIQKQDTGGERNWYAIHTYAGYEDAVVRNLLQRAESMGMTDKIFDAIVPTEKTIKIKGTKRVEEDEKVFPGYILVDMIVDDKSWYVVRNTPRVTGFVGTGVNPVPVTDKEMLDVVNRMKQDTSKHESAFAVGEPVVIVDGPFKETEGSITSFDAITGKVKVSVSMFGRETEVELDSLQVQAI